jgi:DNA-binding response OmpR family regulator
MDSAVTILVADGDPVTQVFLGDNLTADGYRVLCADGGPQALEMLCTETPHLVVVDLEGATLTVIDAIRNGVGEATAVDPGAPIIVLGRRLGEVQRVRLLERGADDVLAKPFSYPELRARVGALQRRAKLRSAPRILQTGPLRIDLSARQVRVGERAVALAAKEYALLVALATEPTRVFTKWELLREVWGFRSPGRTRTLDSHAARLRRKLAQAGACGLVRNVWGVGYQLHA